MNYGTLVVLSGPSAGVGKDTILRLFLEQHPDWKQPPSTTTREPRPGEQAGKDMSFVSHKEFAALKDAGKFLETDFHASNWYGTLKEPVVTFLAEGRNVIVRVDVNGALEIKRLMPEAILVLVTVESLQILEARLRARQSETEAQIQERLSLAKRELLMADQFDYTIINPEGHPEMAAQDLASKVGA